MLCIIVVISTSLQFHGRLFRQVQRQNEASTAAICRRRLLAAWADMPLGASP
jgi:hypothetical protein